MKNRSILAAVGSALLLFSASASFAQSFDYRYTKTMPGGSAPGPIDPVDPVEPEPVYAQCSNPVTGVLLDHGQSVLAFASPTVAWSSACSSQERLCEDGVLGGTFTYPSCARLDPVACILPWGGTLAHAGSAIAYAQPLATPASPCIPQERVCSDGQLSGSFTAETCMIADDFDPDPFTFETVTEVPFNTLTASEIVPITGIYGDVTARLSSYTDSAAFRICADAACGTVVHDWRTSTIGVVDGQFLQVRQMSANALSTSRQKTVRVGTYSTNFIVRSQSAYCGGVGNVCEDGTVYIGSFDNKHLAVMHCDAGQVWNGSSCTGTRIQRPFYTSNSSVITGICGNWNGTGTACWDGLGNTAKLVAASANYRAAAYCDGLTQNGHSDWFLPAIGQFVFMASLTQGDSGLLATIPNQTSYAAASERDSGTVWDMVSNASGVLSPSSAQKTPNKYLRCMRVLN